MGVAVQQRRRTRIALRVAAVLVVAGLAAVFWQFGPRLFAPSLDRGVRAYASGDYRTARTEARQALKQHPGDDRAIRLMARATARLGDFGSALNLYDRIGPKALEAEDFYLVGMGMSREGKNNFARSALEMGLSANPNQPEILQELGRISAGSDHVCEAVGFGERLAKIPGWEVRGLIISGMMHSLDANPGAAAQAYERALQLDPKLKGAVATPQAVRVDLATQYLRLGKPAEARKHLEMVLAEGPDRELSWLLSRAAMQAGDAAAAKQALAAAGDFRQDRPDAIEPAPFVGAAACAGCHRDLFRMSQSDRHAKTFRPAAALDYLPLLDRPKPDPGDAHVVHTLKREDGTIVQETREGRELRRALVAYAVGSGDRGLTPVGRDQSGTYRELRLSFYGDIQGWDATTGHATHPKNIDQFLGEPLEADSIRRCLDCHTTNFRAARDQVGPEAQDRGIGCERCHGPAGNHLKAMALHLPDPAIGRPRLASPERVTQLCGQCHSPRGRLTDENDPGAVRFQALSLSKSRCYNATDAGLSCTTCHNPHRDADTDPSYYEQKCLACHSATPPPAVAASARPSRSAAALPEGVRRVPCPVNATSNCLECHMPQVKDIVPHTIFTDHEIRVHREKKGTAAGE